MDVPCPKMNMVAGCVHGSRRACPLRPPIPGDFTSRIGQVGRSGAIRTDADSSAHTEGMTANRREHRTIAHVAAVALS